MPAVSQTATGVGTVVPDARRGGATHENDNERTVNDNSLRRPRWESGPHLPLAFHLYRPIVPSEDVPIVAATGARRLRVRRRPMISAQTCAIIAMRVAEGTSLRALAGEYDVSHETIRRLAQLALGNLEVG